MTPEELKELLEKALADVKALKTKNQELETKADAAQTKMDELLAKGDNSGVIEELKDEISDLRSKMKKPTEVVTPEQKQAMHELVIKGVVGSWLKGKTEGTPMDFMKYIETEGAERIKTLEITNADNGGRAVAEILSNDVIEYAREFSPILGEVGRKPSMTRNFRELVLVSYPSTQAGIENVAGTAISETSTQTYKEVKSKEFKVNAKPRITDEAMYGADMDLYGDLIRLLGEEIGIYLAAQVLYGDASGKSARGILSSSRIDITNTTGKSFKPTLAPNPADARDADFFPVKPTGVDAAFGATDKAIVDFVIDLSNELPTKYLAGAKFYMNRKTKGVFEKVRDANDNPIFRPDYRTGGMSLNGYPVVIDDTLPNVASNSTPLIFGDLRRAFAINDGDIDKLLLDPYTVDGCTVVKYDKEMFEMIQASDAIIVVAATTNAGS